jgi:hypothetical protein
VLDVTTRSPVDRMMRSPSTARAELVRGRLLGVDPARGRDLAVAVLGIVEGGVMTVIDKVMLDEGDRIVAVAGIPL